MKAFFSNKSMTIAMIVILAAGGTLYHFVNQGPDHTPTEVVQKWISVYPDNLVKAATFTTTTLRGGLSNEEWIDQGKATLGDFHYLDGKVVSETITGDHAEVLLDARIASTLGEQLQREQYRLTLVNNHWVIEEKAIVVVFPPPPSFS